MDFFYLFNVIIFFRLFFLFRDKPLALKPALFLSLFQVIPLLLFNIDFLIISVAVILVVINLLLCYFEKSGKMNGYRFISFILLFLLSAVSSSEYFNLSFNQSIINLFKDISLIFPSFMNEYDINPYKTLVVISGVLILLNEINFLIRYFFEVLKLYPVYANENKPVDEKEYNAGRVIGMLERILIFLFVLVNEITIIGFIIAAKGFTRFKDLDKRDFAEYVLIGTLLSTFFALIISYFIRTIIA